MWKKLVLIACVLALPSTAFGRDVYLNGVKLDSNVILTNASFPACEVKFDEKGNVWITAKGFNVQVKEAPKDKDVTPAPAPGDKITKRYWLVSKQGKRGTVQYDVDVYVNEQWVKKVRSTDDPTVLDVTKHVKPGENKVKLLAVKNIGDKRVSSSPSDVLEIVLGEGTVAGGTVTIDKSLLSYQRNASETQSFNDTFTFTGR